MDNTTQSYLKGIVESLLFVSEKPVTLEQIKESVASVGPAELRRIIADLQQEYDANNRGMVILEIAGGYQMLSSPQYVSYIRNFFKTKVKEKLSKPSLETLAIIAYKQPVSRADVEFIRGVNSDGVVSHLLEKELIKVVGRKEIPGRPFIYGTTKQFLEYFGLKSLEDLPRLENFPAFFPTLPQADAPVTVAGEEPSSGVEEQESLEETAPAGTLRAAVAEEIAVAGEKPRAGEIRSVPSETSGEPEPNTVLDLKRAMEEVAAEEQAAAQSAQGEPSGRMKKANYETEG